MKNYPSEICRAHLRVHFERNPITLNSRLELTTYICDEHNVINKYLQKEIFDCIKLEETYGGAYDEDDIEEDEDEDDPEPGPKEDL